MLPNPIDFLEKIAELPILVSIRKGLAVSFPLIMTGAAAQLVLNLPSAWLHKFLTDISGGHWRSLCELIYQGSFSMATLAVLIATSASYANHKNTLSERARANSKVTSAVCLACYFVIAIPRDAPIPQGFFSLVSGGFPIAISVAVIGTPLFLFLLGHLQFGYFSRIEISDSDFHDALAAVPAATVMIFICALARVLSGGLGQNNLHLLAQNFFAAPFTGAEPNLLMAIKYILLSQFFWFFGLHGPNLLYMVESHVLVPAAVENLSALSAGLEPQNFFTKSFVDAFVHVGGSGATLALILAIFFRSNDIGTRRLAMVALLPALFNINEILLLGLPLVLNPAFAIPFFLAPVAQILVAYVAMALHLVPMTAGTIPWTSPPILGGYFATGSPSGAVLQLVCLGVGTLIYLPFVKMANAINLRRFQKSLDALCHAASETTFGAGRRKFIDLSGPEGHLARILAVDLANALQADDQIHLEYQPQIDLAQCCVIGAEALLRWRHPIHGPIPAVVSVALAEDTGLMDRLTKLILLKACNQQMALVEKGIVGLKLSVNISGSQFRNTDLVNSVNEVLDQSGLPPYLLQLEVTETMALSHGMQSTKILGCLQEMGVLVAIDDFGMGYTSLRYLKEFAVDTVKIDRSLTQDSASGINDHIINSIVHLCEALDISIVVEGVETPSQLERFREHRCNLYQGFLFSYPLPAEAYVEYCERNHPYIGSLVENLGGRVGWQSYRGSDQGNRLNP
jgi:PTS system cellobiose-specific IIC component